MCTVVRDKANWLINKDNNIGHGAEFTSGEESFAKTISALAELVAARALQRPELTQAEQNRIIREHQFEWLKTTGDTDGVSQE